MKQYFEQLCSRIFGNPNSFTVEHRVFNATLFLVICAGGLSLVQCIICGLTWQMVATNSAVSVISFLIYIQSRANKNWRRMVIPGYLIFGGILVFCWFQEGGLFGGIGYYFFILSGAAIIVFSGFQKLIALVFVAITIIPLVLLEFFHSDFVNPYTSRAQQYTDVTYSLLLGIVVNALMVLFLYFEYQRERTAKNELVESLTQEKAKVEEAVIAKQRLLSMITHDISNALFVINSSAQDLSHQDNDGDEEIIEIRSNMHSAINNMREIVESVRLLEESAAGQESLKMELVCVRPLVQKVRDMFAVQLKEKNVQFEIAIPPDDPSAMYVEANIFCNHVLSNLIWNAIKFSYPGSRIIVNTVTTGDEVEISITDFGVGIPVDKLEYVFVPGMKFGRCGTAGEPSSGLGLPVVKSFVEMFGGRIALSSKIATIDDSTHGTTVHVYCRTSACKATQPVALSTGAVS